MRVGATTSYVTPSRHVVRFVHIASLEREHARTSYSVVELHAEQFAHTRSEDTVHDFTSNVEPLSHRVHDVHSAFAVKEQARERNSSGAHDEQFAHTRSEVRVGARASYCTEEHEEARVRVVTFTRYRGLSPSLLSTPIWKVYVEKGVSDVTMYDVVVVLSSSEGTPERLEEIKTA